MESIMLTIKFAMFYGFMVFVVAAVGGTAIAVLYRIIRRQGGDLQIPESRVAEVTK